MRKEFLLIIPIIFVVILSGSYPNTHTNTQTSSITFGKVVDAQSLTSQVTSIASSSNSVKTVTNKLNQLKTIIITGMVLRCDNGSPFEGVTITAMSMDGQSLATTITGTNGFYKLVFQSADNVFKIIASYPSHIPKTQEVTVSPSITNHTDPNLYGNANFQLGTIDIIKGTRDTIGIDSNNPGNVGPNQTQIQLFIKNSGTTNLTNVWANFTWTSLNPNINLANAETSLKYLGNITPGQTLQLFYLLEAARNKASIDGIRNYTVNVWEQENTSNNGVINGTISLIGLNSQNSNTVVSIKPSSNAVYVDDIFTVTVNSSTRKQLNFLDLPLIKYDPSVIEPLNYTVSYASGQSNILTLQETGQNNEYIGIWTFRAKNAGNGSVSGIIYDQSGGSEHYNSNYGDPITILSNLTILPTADIRLNQTYDNYSRPGQTPQYNDLVRFNITISNYGPSNATGLNITDLIPAGLTYVSNAISTNGGTSWTPNSTAYNPITGNWTIGNMSNDSIGQYILSIVAKVTGTNMTLNNTATAKANEFDKNLTNNNASVTFNVSKAADISVSTQFMAALCNGQMWPPISGQTILCMINVTNNGPDNTTGIMITDMLSPKLIFKAYSLSVDGGNTWNSNLKGLIPKDTYNETTGIWNVGNLNSGASKSLTISVKINATANMTITNMANKTAENEFDWNTTNDNSTASITVA